jgi:transcriptional regulator with XRE-family HTH domain
LAEAAKISRASIANIERGHHRVQIHVLYEIAAALGVEAHDLLPHATRANAARRLPADVSKKLDPAEQVAVGRLLDPKQGENSDQGK